MSDQIQTDPEVRDRIGEAIMKSMICTHEFQEMVCGVCWESTQRIGEALVRSLPQLQIQPAELSEAAFDKARVWQQVGEDYRVVSGDRIRAEFADGPVTETTKSVSEYQGGVAIRHLFASPHPVNYYSVRLESS